MLVKASRAAGLQTVALALCKQTQNALTAQEGLE